MAEQKSKPEAAADSGAQVQEQAQEQAGQRQIQVRIDEREMDTAYANAFRTNPTTEEVMIDFGTNLLTGVNQQQQQQQQGEGQPDATMLFKITNRVVMNYYTAKRLAVQLGQVIRNHEQQFGELKLNARDRMAEQPKK